ncbi:MAG: VOC family protein [Rhizobiales bacterium]|nr:VOC family protein [Hyphomicrobiales bacterium]
MHQRVSLLTLGVDDVARARGFYERLGWQASSASMEEIAFFQVGSLGLALYPKGNVAEDLELAEAPSPGGVTLSCNVESEALVDRFLEEAVGAGGRLMVAARKMPWGGYVGSFADPDGHCWEIAHVPMFALAEDGALLLPE